MRPSAPPYSLIAEADRVDLLILQTTHRELPEQLLSRYARNIIFISSNVLYDDEVAEGFVTELFRLLLKRLTIKEAFNSSLKSLILNDKYADRFACCCFHAHDSEVCTFQKEYNKKLQQTGRQPEELSPYKNVSPFST